MANQFLLHPLHLLHLLQKSYVLKVVVNGLLYTMVFVIVLMALNRRQKFALLLLPLVVASPRLLLFLSASLVVKHPGFWSRPVMPLMIPVSVLVLLKVTVSVFVPMAPIQMALVKPPRRFLVLNPMLLATLAVPLL